ncbi:MAG: TrmB family transcriptional regulator [Nanobdellota archaeon]
MLPDILKQIGLNQSEIKVYLALLDLGEAKSGEILKAAGLNSGRIYEVFDSLHKKGFISSIVKSGTRYFSPADPSNIQDYIAQKEKEIQKQKQDFDEVLPDILNKIESQRGEIRVQVFQGLDGIKSAYHKELEYARKAGFVNILGVTSRASYANKVYDFFVYNQQPRRRDLNISIRKVLDISSRPGRQSEHESNAEIRYFSFASPVSYTITAGLVIIGIHSDEKNSITIVIESETVSKSFIQQFEVVWNAAKG